MHPKFDLCQYLDDKIHAYLVKFLALGQFGYSSYLFFIFLHQKFANFKDTGLNARGQAENQIPYYKLTYLFLRKPNKLNFQMFIDRLMTVAYYALKG